MGIIEVVVYISTYTYISCNELEKVVLQINVVFQCIELLLQKIKANQVLQYHAINI